MTETAAHLVDRVFPRVPVRQWVLSLPYALRYRLAYDVSLVNEVLAIFTRTVFVSLIRRAGEFGAERKPKCGAVSFIQRFDSALRLNLHIHMLAFDGIYAADDNDRPQFQVLLGPDDGEIARLTASLAQRITKRLDRHSLRPDSDPEESDSLRRDEPWLAGLYAAAVSGRTAYGPNAGRRVTRVGDQIDPESMDFTLSPRCASVDGFSLHADVAVHAEDRPRLERLARYCARPPIAMERLEPLADGRVLYRFKRPWRDGTTHIVMDPLELLEKLSALVPAPRVHLTRYAGVLAPAAKWRPLIVPESSAIESTQQESAATETATSTADTTAASPATAPAASRPGPCRHGRNYTWAELMRRVFELDVMECPRCLGRMKIVAAIHASDAIRKILDCMGLPSRAPPVAPAVSDLNAQMDSF